MSPGRKEQGDGQSIRVKVGQPAHGGSMVGRHEDKVVFVDGALPGEDVTVEVTDNRQRFMRGRVLEIHEPHPQRRDHQCEAAAAGAGCCDYDCAEPSLQREMKAHVVADLLTRIGHLNNVPWSGKVNHLPGQDPSSSTGWRVRQRLAVTAEGTCGLRATTSNRVITVPCAQTHPALLEPVTTWCAGQDDTIQRVPSELVIGLDTHGQHHAVQCSLPEERYRKDKRGRAISRRARQHSPAWRNLIAGTGLVEQTVQGRTWLVPVESFWQAHWGAPEAYSAFIEDRVKIDPGENAWDLYGGCGVFAHSLLCLQPHIGAIDSVDVADDAISAGKTSFAQQHNVHFTQAPVEKWVHRPPQQDVSVVVLDPPRSGAGRTAIAAIAAAHPRHIIHFGCDPAAFARDCAYWHNVGYEISHLEVFDAFPNTHHVECLAELTPVL